MIEMDQQIKLLREALVDCERGAYITKYQHMVSPDHVLNITVELVLAKRGMWAIRHMNACLNKDNVWVETDKLSVPEECLFYHDEALQRSARIFKEAIENTLATLERPADVKPVKRTRRKSTKRRS